MGTAVTSANTNVQDQGTRVLVRNSSGTPYVVVFDENEGGVEVWKGNSTTPTSFSEQDATNNPANTNYHAVSAAIDSNDILHIVYMEDAGKASQLWHVEFNADGTTDTWGTPEAADADIGSDPTSTANFFTSISIDAFDVPHVAYFRYDSDMGADYQTVAYINKDGGSWSSPVTVDGAPNSLDAHYPEITINQDGLAVITYVRSTTADAVYIGVADARIATTFTLGQISTIGSSATQRAGSIAVDTNGRTYVASGCQGITNTLFYHDDGDSWSTWSSTTAGFSAQTVLGISVDGTDVYFIGEDSQNDIRYDVFDGTSTWAGDTALQTGTFDTPQSKWAYLFNYDSTGGTGAIVRSFFYFNDSTPSDPNSVWTNDANAFDSSPTTKADCSTAGSISTNYLRGDGTSASGISGTILGVYVVAAGTRAVNPGGTIWYRVFTSSDEDLSGSDFIAGDTTTADFAYGYELATPTGGWSLSVLQNLYIIIWNDTSSNGGDFHMAKLFVVSSESSSATEIDYSYANGTNIEWDTISLAGGTTNSDTITSSSSISATSSDTITSDSNIQDTFSDSIVSDTNIITQNSETIISDTNIHVTMSDSITSDTTIQDTFSDIITSNTNILLSQSDTIISNTNIKTTSSETITTDSFVQTTSADSIVSDSNIIQNLSDTITSDSVIQTTNSDSVTSNSFINTIESNNITSDSAITSLVSSFIVSNSYIQGGNQQLIQSDSVISKSGMTETIISDTSIGDVFSDSVVSDSYINKTFSDSVTTDSFINKTASDNITSDSEISLALVTYSDTITSTAVINRVATDVIVSDSVIKTTITSTITSDSIIQTSSSDSIVSDSIISSSSQDTILSDAYISTTNSDSVVSDSVINKSFSSEISSDADIKNAVSQTILSDSYVLGGNQRLIQSTSVIRKEGMSGTITSDSSIQDTFSDSITSNTQLVAGFSDTIQSSSVIKKTDQSDIILSDSLINKTFSDTIVTDSVISKMFSDTITTDLNITKGTADSISSDSVIKNGVTDTINSNSIINMVNSDSITTDSVIQITQTEQISGDLTINKTSQDSITGDSSILLRNTETITSDTEIDAGTTIGATIISNSIIFKTLSSNIYSDSFLTILGLKAAKKPKLFGGIVTKPRMLKRK